MKSLDLRRNDYSRPIKLKHVLSFILYLFLFFVAGSISAQESIKIDGTVKDAKGEILPGVSVMLKGSNVRTMTDASGKFSIKVPGKQSILILTYLGYEDMEINASNSLGKTIVMTEKTSALDEVIVIGYGSVKKSNLTTAVSKINADAIENRPITTLSEAFSGQLAGVQTQVSSGVPGEDLQITVRGNNSLNSASPPLYVVDGVIAESISNINPSDVASIQVLKDAAATSIYGARGSNGVVLVETKRAKAGVPTVTFSSLYGLQQGDRLIKVMSPKEYLAYNVYAINALYLSKGGANSMEVPNKLRPSGDRIPESWLLNPNSDTPDWRLRDDLPQTNWINEILRDAPMQNYQLSAAGRSNVGSINVSAGYIAQDGIVKNTGFQRTNLRMNGELILSKKVKAGANLAPTFSKQHRGESEGKDKAILMALQTSPLLSIDKGTRDLGWDPTLANKVNPYQRLISVTDDKQDKSFASSAWLEYTILPKLVFKTLYGYNVRNSIYEYFVPGNVVAPNASGGPVSSGSSYSETYGNQSIQNTLSYKYNSKTKHNIEIMLGQSADETKIYRADLAATGWPLETVSTLNLATVPTKASTIRYVVRTASFFGRASYDYKNKYLLTASIRQDGSTRFGSGNKWGVFPSFSGGWKINEEEFMKTIDKINLLKLRASWGMSGNDRIGYNDYLSTFGVINAVYGGTAQPGIYAKNVANPDLKWETTKSVDLGFDLSMFNNYFQFNFDYYINRTSDLLYNLNIPATTGFSTMRSNYASLENRGWEIDLTSMNINNKRLKWTTTFNLSKSKNKVLDMGGNDNVISDAWNSYFITKVGGPVSQFYLFRTDGLLTKDDFGIGPDGNYDKTQPLVPIMNNQIPGNYKFVDANKDGKIDDNDRVAYGSNVPDLLYGITNRFSYKNFELSVFLQGQFGGDVFFLASRNINYGKRADNNLVDWIHGYKEVYKGGDPIPYDLGVDMSWDGKTPLAYGLGANGVNENTVTDQRIYDATFLRIKNVNLSYSFSKKTLNKIGIRNAKLYCAGENLYTFTKYIGDPEVNSFAPNNPMIRGVDYSTYPLTRRYTLGLNLTF